VTLEKTWNDKGNYTVRVKAKDTYGSKSDWALQQVQIKDIFIEITIGGGLGVSATIKNNGTVNLTNVSWSIHLDGKLIFVGKNRNGTITSLAVGEETKVKDFVIGFGKTGILAEVKDAKVNATGTALLFFVLRVT
jgi:uncharacterized membrane protein